MIEILNNLPDYCEDCPYIALYNSEILGSGRFAYSCKHLCQCMRLYTKFKKMEEREKNDTQT